MARNEWDAAADANTARGPTRLLPPPAAASARLKNDGRLSRQGSGDAAQKHRQSLRAMAESLSMARETAHTLSMQSEQLGRNERAVEDAQYAVDVSKRIMRGMAWSGWIANAFTAAPKRDSDAAAGGSDPSVNGAKQANGSGSEITMGFICPECKVMFKNPEELAMHYGKAHERVDTRDVAPATSASRARQEHRGSFRPLRGGDQQTTITAATASATDDIHEQFLRDLSPQLAELKQASLALGNALDTQNHQLDRLDGKIDTVHDGMKRVSVQAKKLTGRRLPPVFRFRCAFQEVATRKFVKDVDGEAILCADVLVDGCTFRAYTLGDDTEMWGFQNESSSFFLGLNRFGNLKIRGSDLQSYEQFAIEHGKVTTTLFAFASYFGYGGWVTRKDDESGKLTIVRGSPENKSSAAQFKVINLDQIQSELTTTK